jgi:hypothetical protein
MSIENEEEVTRKTINDDECTYSDNTSSRKNVSGDNSVIMMFTSSLVTQTASSQLRLPANFVGVQSVRQDFKNPRSKNGTVGYNGGDFDDKDKLSRLRASNDVKFCVVDENGSERRMTKAEKKLKKFQIAQAKKEAKKEAAAIKKRKLEELTFDDTDLKEGESHRIADNEAMEQQKKDLQLSSKGGGATTSGPYHQLPINATTMDQELAEFQGKRGSTPPVILSPPMALQFLSMKNTLSRADKSPGCHDDGGSAILVYDHSLSQEWADRLKHQCVLPAEAVRQKEDLRPLAYRLQPEPWQRLRPSLDENPVVTASRNHTNAVRKSFLSSSPPSAANEEGTQTSGDMNPKPRDWCPLTCRPRMKSLPELPTSIQHDDVLSIVFEYIYRETPYHVSCGAKFGSDFLVYDGPRDERHAFAGLRVLSRCTSLMTRTASKSTTAPSSSPQIDQNSEKLVSNDNAVELPLPTAYSLTGFVRCLNTAGKLALLATVDEVSDSDDNSENESSTRGVDIQKKRYRVAIVDVALEKVLDVHKRKNRGRSGKKKLQKRRDVTQTLSKK